MTSKETNIISVQDNVLGSSTVKKRLGYRYINRELSWLAFNDRVLSECYNERHPLLERLRFLSISGSNLDEFYMVRVAGLKAQIAAGISESSQDGLTPSQQLESVEHSSEELRHKQSDTWKKLAKQLEMEKISVVEMDGITNLERSWLEKYFKDSIQKGREKLQ